MAVQVNEVTPELFTLAPDAAAMAAQDIAVVQKIIQPIGLAPTKAKNLVNMAKVTRLEQLPLAQRLRSTHANAATSSRPPQPFMLFDVHSGSKPVESPHCRSALPAPLCAHPCLVHLAAPA